MAVTRIQSISVFSLSASISHRLSPPEHESLVDFGVEVPDEASNDSTIADVIDYSPDYSRMLTDFLLYVESSGHTRKIRKNAVVQELIIAYSKDDFGNSDISDILELIRSDIKSFFLSFKEKFGFIPFSCYFIHENDGKYHVHILFSLKEPDLLKKVRWKKRTYFDLIKRMSAISPRISVPHKGKNIGAYPLWLIRKLEARYGRETAKKLVKVARERGYPAKELIENAEKLQKLLSPRPPSP